MFRRVIRGTFGKVAKELAEGLRPAQAMTIGKPIYLLGSLIPSNGVGGRRGHLTRK
jgi:hypothetical protein